MAARPQYDDRGRVSVWRKKTKAGADYLGGELTDDQGRKFFISLFYNDKRKSEREPEWRGNIKIMDQQPAPMPHQPLPSGAGTPQSGQDARHYDEHGRLLNDPFVNGANTGRQLTCPKCDGLGYDTTGLCNVCKGKRYVEG